MSKKLCYVTGPRSEGDLTTNIRTAHTAAMALLKAGFAVIVPHGSVFWGNVTTIAPLRRSAEGGLSTSTGFIPETNPHGVSHTDWLAASLELVRRCDILLRLPGESVGADREAECALQAGLKVYWDLAYLIEQEAGGVSLPTFDDFVEARASAIRREHETGEPHEVENVGEKWVVRVRK